MKNNSIFILIGCISYLLTSCIYGAGNRKSDLNYGFHVTVNSFYVEKFIKSKFMKATYNEPPLTSELVNYPNDFVPITDSVNGYKYVIECRVGPTDSINNTGWGLSLCSLYDFKKQKWIKERDSLQQDEIQTFKKFFKKNILEKTMDEFRDKVPDSILLKIDIDEFQ